MSTSSAVYVFGSGQNEQQRLVAQAEGLEAEARWLLDRVGVERGWRVADIGCGPIGILNLLSERVGSEGVATGIEREPRFADMARAETARRGFTNVRVIQADALGAGMSASNLDFVHERLLLINVPAPNQMALVAQMLALLRPGGTIALQDWDRVSFLCHPPHPAWTKLLDAYSAAFSASGGNGATGRSLAALLRAHGVEEIGVKVHVKTIGAGESRRTHLLSLLESMHDKVLAFGKLSEAELEENKQALLHHLTDPSTLVIDSLLVQAWGRKPG